MNEDKERLKKREQDRQGEMEEDTYIKDVPMARAEAEVVSQL